VSRKRASMKKALTNFRRNLLILGTALLLATMLTALVAASVLYSLRGPRLTAAP
jgi:hypothetical protein